MNISSATALRDEAFGGDLHAVDDPEHNAGGAGSPGEDDAWGGVSRAFLTSSAR
jgi:hypothetical protein